MTNLPTNPTKTEILEKYWYEFLQFIRNSSGDETDALNRLIAHGGYETAFWAWYLDRKLGDTNDPAL